MEWQLIIKIAFVSLCIANVAGDEVNCYSSFFENAYTCKTTFAGEDVSLKVEVDTCRENPKITVGVKIDALTIDFKETFHSSQEIPIPGFYYFGTGAKLKVEIISETSGDTKLKVYIVVGLFSSTLNKLKVVDDTIGKSNCNSFVYWWNSQSTGIKAAVGGSGGLVFIILIVCCCKCCCCKKNANRGQVVVHQAPAANHTNLQVINNATTTMPNFIPMTQPPPPPYQKF